MRTDRRTLLQSALAGLLVSALPLRVQAGALSVQPHPDVIFLNRLTYGATEDSLAHLGRLGRAAWLEEQLALPPEDQGLAARLSHLRLRLAYEAGDNGEGGTWPARDEALPLSTLTADPASLLPLLDWTVPMDYAERSRPGWEVVAAALPRAVHAPAQLREVMTQFWHDHFNVHSQKNEYCSVFFPLYDATLRAHAFGNFRTLLGEVARSPSMLFYLNNDESRASPANENFARELLELHTLGVGNYLNDRHSGWAEVPKGADGVALGYIDEDVYEVARAFTGWTVGDGRWISEGVEATPNGRFYYAEAWHDPYQKRILGIEFPPNRAAMADGDQVLDLLARHPATARFVTEKIARRLLSDTPSDGLIDHLAQVFLAASEAPDQIAQVIRALVTHPEFDATPPQKLRRPFEFMAALYRASGAKVACPENDYHWQLQRAGWMQHTFPPPIGHPDVSQDWLSGTMLPRLVDFAIFGHDDWFGCTKSRLSDALPEGLATQGDLTRVWARRCLGYPEAELPDYFEVTGMAPETPLPEDAVERHDLSIIALAFAAMSPQFLFR